MSPAMAKDLALERAVERWEGEGGALRPTAALSRGPAHPYEAREDEAREAGGPSESRTSSLPRTVRLDE